LLARRVVLLDPCLKKDLPSSPFAFFRKRPFSSGKSRTWAFVVSPVLPPWPDTIRSINHRSTALENQSIKKRAADQLRSKQPSSADLAAALVRLTNFARDFGRESPRILPGVHHPRPTFLRRISFLSSEGGTKRTKAQEGTGVAWTESLLDAFRPVEYRIPPSILANLRENDGVFFFFLASAPCRARSPRARAPLQLFPAAKHSNRHCPDDLPTSFRFRL